MIESMLGAAGAATFFVTGLATGALLCYWRASVKKRREPTRRGNYPMPWDIHCVLNAMNKMALTAERARPIEPGLIYLISDYLLHSTLIQREDGWVDRNSLEAWLLAHVRVLADHRGQASLPSVTVNISDNIRRVHGHKLIRQLLWCLHRALNVTRIHIEVQPVPIGHLHTHLNAVATVRTRHRRQQRQQRPYRRARSEHRPQFHIQIARARDRQPARLAGAIPTEKTSALGMSYDLGVVKLMGQFIHQKDGVVNGVTEKFQHVSVSVPVGSMSAFNIGFGREREKTAGVTTAETDAFGVQYQYSLSKRTTMYAAISSFKNEVVGTTTKGQQLAAGMRHAF